MIFPSIEGDSVRWVDTNRFVSEIHQIWKDLLLLDSPNAHPQFLKKTTKEVKFELVNDVFREDA